MPPEIKEKMLDLLDRMRKAVEDDDREALQLCGLEALTVALQILGRDVPDFLPVVIVG